MAYHTPIVAAADWRTDPRAARILSSLGERTPPSFEMAERDRWYGDGSLSDSSTAYAGFRVWMLKTIREQIVGAQLREAEAIGDVPLMKAVCAQISVQDAIRESVA